jgi:hypothetical protein
MIKYALVCQKSHEFEAWFQSSATFDRQAKRGLVVCPECGSHKVSKAIMAPRVARRDKGAASPPPIASGEQVPAQAMTAANMAPTGAAAEMLQMMRKLRDEVVKNAENVGPRFAEEARKIHYEEAPQRGIYGEASPQDVKALHEEGIECYPLPKLPDDRN